MRFGPPIAGTASVVHRNRYPTPAPRQGRGDRRTAWRYPLQLDLRYRLRKKDRLVGEGSGKTIDISSKGLLLALSPQPSAKGAVAELSIFWPLQHEPSIPQWLNVIGEVLRTDERGVAVRIARYDFSSPPLEDTGTGP